MKESAIGRTESHMRVYIYGVGASLLVPLSSFPNCAPLFPVVPLTLYLDHTLALPFPSSSRFFALHKFPFSLPPLSPPLVPLLLCPLCHVLPCVFFLTILSQLSILLCPHFIAPCFHIPLHSPFPCFPPPPFLPSFLFLFLLWGRKENTSTPPPHLVSSTLITTSFPWLKATRVIIELSG